MYKRNNLMTFVVVGSVYSNFQTRLQSIRLTTHKIIVPRFALYVLYDDISTQLAKWQGTMGILVNLRDSTETLYSRA